MRLSRKAIACVLRPSKCKSQSICSDCVNAWPFVIYILKTVNAFPYPISPPWPSLDPFKSQGKAIGKAIGNWGIFPICGLFGLGSLLSWLCVRPCGFGGRDLAACTSICGGGCGVNLQACNEVACVHGSSHGATSRRNVSCRLDKKT